MPPKKKRKDAPAAEEPHDDRSERGSSSDDEGELQSPPEDEGAHSTTGDEEPRPATNLMDERTAELSRGDKNEVHAAMHHMIAALKSDPSLYRREEFGYLREFVDYASTHREQFPSMIGDRPSDGNFGGMGPDLTKGYVHMLSVGGDTSFVDYPIVQVLSRRTKYRQPAYKKGSFGKGRVLVPMQHTQLRVRDGDDNQVMLNIATHLTGESRRLNGGEVLKLEMYTPLTYQVDQDDPERRPFLFVTKYSVVGYYAIPDNPNVLPAPLACSNPPSIPTRRQGAGPKGTEVDPCPDGHCNCATEDVGMDRCICKSNPPDQLNLQTIKEDCYFANKEVVNMTLSERRCMLYWWYATNVYGVCGKGKRLQLPDCLVCAVRRRFPEPDGNYTGYEEYLDSV